MILVDIDDVLLDWIGGFEAFVKSKGIQTKTNRPMNWDLGAWIEHDRVIDLVTEFNNSRDFGTLLPVDGAVGAISQLAEKHEIHAITCCGESEDIIRRRAVNIKAFFGDDIGKITCLPLGVSKIDALKVYPKGSVWIEDKWENAVDGAELGMRSILLDKPYNGGQKQDERVTRLHRWCDIVDHIKENS